MHLAHIVGSAFDGSPVDVRVPELGQRVQALVRERPATSGARRRRSTATWRAQYPRGDDGPSMPADRPRVGSPISTLDQRSGPVVGLLERSAELATLDSALAAVGEGSRGRMVLVGGEAGVGKTSLLREFCDEQRARILWGACDAMFTPRPLGPFFEIGEAVGGDLARARGERGEAARGHLSAARGAGRAAGERGGARGSALGGRGHARRAEAAGAAGGGRAGAGDRELPGRRARPRPSAPPGAGGAGHHARGRSAERRAAVPGGRRAARGGARGRPGRPLREDRW